MREPARSARVARDNRWIAPRPDRPRALLRLFCFPYAGAGAAAFRDWTHALPAEIDVCRVDPPGRFARADEPPIDRMATFVESFDDAAGPLLDRPFGVFGYSLGALMAFEWACAVRTRHGLTPVHLIVAARRAPQCATMSPVALSGLAQPALVAALEDSYGPLEPSLKADPGMLSWVVENMRADLRMMESYRYGARPPLSCPILAVGGTEDPTVNVHELIAWGEQTTAACEVELVPWPHFFLHTAGAVLLDHVSRRLRAPSPAASAHLAGGAAPAADASATASRDRFPFPMNR
jgi:surfactin synthase thioesterase subunit